MLAPVRAVVVVSVALLVWWLAMAGHSGWPRTAGPTALTLLSSSGAPRSSAAAAFNSSA